MGQIDRTGKLYRPLGLVLTAIVVPLLGLSGCDRKAEDAPLEPALAGDAQYLAGPELLEALGGNGQVHRLRGQAGAVERIRVKDSSGNTYGVTSGAQGQFEVLVPPQPVPRLFELARQVGTRLIRSEGLLFLPPEGGPAVILRYGAPSMPVGPVVLPIAAFDYDNSGSAAIAGAVAPRSEVTVLIDGREAGRTLSDARGVYALSLSVPVATGTRRIRIVSAGEAFERDVRILPSDEFFVAAEAGGWRVRWPLPGGNGGGQTTLILR